LINRHTTFVTTETCARGSRNEPPGFLLGLPHMPITNDPRLKARASQQNAANSDGGHAEANAKSETSDNSKDPVYDEGLTPLGYMLRVVQDTNASKARRDAMARAATPYVHSRLSPIAPPVEQESEFQKKMKEASNSLRRKVADLRARLESRVSREPDGG